MMADEKRMIDANALLYEYCQANGCNEVIDEVCPNCFTAGLIANAPTVDAVEVVHGRWEDFSDDRHHWKRMDLRCSICNKRASSFVGGSEDWWDSYKPNYCPNCGAKMDGDGNG